MMRGLEDAGARAGATAVLAATGALAARIAVAAPDVAVSVDDGVVRLAAPGLVSRVFGSRRRGPDPRLAAIVGGGA